MWETWKLFNLNSAQLSGTLVCSRFYMPINFMGIHTEVDLFLKSQDMASVFEVFWLGSVVNGINVAAFTLKIILGNPTPFKTLIY